MQSHVLKIKRYLSFLENNGIYITLLQQFSYFFLTNILQYNQLENRTIFPFPVAHFKIIFKEDLSIHCDVCE